MKGIGDHIYSNLLGLVVRRGVVVTAALVGALAFASVAAAAGPKTKRVSVSSSGAQGSHESDEPTISANGRFVAFSSNASNLVAGDANGVRDVFRRGPLR